MARTEGRLRTKLWTDQDFLSLSFPAKGGWESVLCQPDVEYTGVMPLRPRRLATLFGIDLEEMIEILEELEDARFIVIDWDTEELLIRTFIRNDEVYRQPNVMRSALRSLGSVSSLRIRSGILTELRRIEAECAEDIPKGSREPLQAMIAVLEKDPPNPSPVHSDDTEQPKSEPMEEPFTEPIPEGMPEPQGDGGAEGSGVGGRGSSDLKVVGTKARSTKVDRGSDDPDFTRWYQRYPRKVKPAAARTAWKTARKKTTTEALDAALEAYIAHWARERTELKYIPHPSSWLNAESWLDDIATRQPTAHTEQRGVDIWA